MYLLNCEAAIVSPMVLIFRNIWPRYDLFLLVTLQARSHMLFFQTILDCTQAAISTCHSYDAYVWRQLCKACTINLLTTIILLTTTTESSFFFGCYCPIYSWDILSKLYNSPLQDFICRWPLIRSTDQRRSAQTLGARRRAVCPRRPNASPLTMDHQRNTDCSVTASVGPSPSVGACRQLLRPMVLQNTSKCFCFLQMTIQRKDFVKNYLKQTDE